MTRPTDGAGVTDAPDVPPRRVVRRSTGLPGGRAVVGGVLIALAAVGTFVSWRQASSPPRHAYAVSTRPLQPGDPLTADDIRYEHIDLPAGLADRAFDVPADIEGRVLVAPMGEGELLQAGVVSDQGERDAAAEVSLALDRDLAVDGRLRPGDTVDVYATVDDATSAVATGLRVFAVSTGGGSFADGSEVTVTLGLGSPDEQVAVIHAARAGKVTLVRTTHVPRSSTAPSSTAPSSTAPSSGPPSSESPASTTTGAEVPG